MMRIAFANQTKLLCVLVPALAGALQATPFDWGPGIKGPLRFPVGTTLTVYIQADPKKAGRDALVQQGIDRWKQTLADHGVTLNTTIGDPPVPPGSPPGAQPANSVVYQWKPDGFKSGNESLGAGKDDGIGGATNTPNKLVAGQAYLRDALPSTSDDEKNYLKNLAEHEMTHALGIGDDDGGQVTSHSQTSTARTAAEFNKVDKAEINQTYAAGSTGGTIYPIAIASLLSGSAALGFYDYAFGFRAAGDPLIDPQSISLINIGIDPMFVSRILAPPGWIALVTHTPADPNDPFFQGYMVDGEPSYSPFGRILDYVSLRASDPNAALSSMNPNLQFIVETTPGTIDGLIDIYAGGDLQTRIGPVATPEPRFALPVGVVLCCGVWWRQMKKSAKALNL